MGAKHNAKHDVIITTARCGGAAISQVARKRHGFELIDWLYENDIRVRRLKDIEPAVLLSYTQYLKARMLSVGTIANKLANIRALLLASQINLGSFTTNSALGLGSRKRTGTKLPFPDDLWEDLLQRARELDLGMYHALRLMRLLGCRPLEAIMSAATVAEWVQQLNDAESVDIYKGSKGGRPRITEVLLSRLDETRIAVFEALQYVKENGFLINGKEPGLKSARKKFHRLAAKLNLKKQYAPTSLRYSYACDKIIECINAGYPRIEIFRFVAQNLGHGSGRGRWVASVYGRTVADQVPGRKKTVTFCGIKRCC